MKAKLLLVCMFGFIIINTGYSQTPWYTIGNNITGNEWLGADGSSTIPLKKLSTKTH